jgi:hypothetical protein
MVAGQQWNAGAAGCLMPAGGSTDEVHATLDDKGANPTGPLSMMRVTWQLCAESGHCMHALHSVIV